MIRAAFSALPFLAANFGGRHTNPKRERGPSWRERGPSLALRVGIAPGNERARLSLLGILVLLASCSASADEKVLYQGQSAYNVILVTENGRGLRTLWFEEGGARQSVVKPGDPDHVELRYARSMTAGLAFVEEPSRVLIVGLGGGTIPMFLHQHYPRTQIDVVDIDPAVIKTAKAYFGFRETATVPRLRGGWTAVHREVPEPYDVIFLDAFGPENIPYDLTTREFLQSVRRACAEGRRAGKHLAKRVE